MIGKEYDSNTRGRNLSKLIETSLSYPFRVKKRVAGVANEIPIGITTFPPEERGHLMMLDLKESRADLILGKRGSGKSTLLKLILSELYYGNYLIIVLPDPRNEYILCKEPLQDKYQKYINPERKDPMYMTGIDTVSFTPQFLTVLNRGIKPNGAIEFQIDPKDADLEDWIKVLNLEESGRYAQLSLFRNAFISYLNLTSPQLIERLLNLRQSGLAGANSTKQKLSENIGSILRIGYFGTKNTIDLGKEIQKRIVVFCTEGKELADPILVNEFLAMMLRKIYYLKRKHNQIKNRRLALIHEEAWDVAPNIQNPPSKKEIGNLIRLGRQPGIYQFFNYQYMYDVPQMIREQATGVFFNYRLNPIHRNEVLDKFDVPFEQRANLSFYPLKANKLTGMREWVFVTHGEMKRFLPFFGTVKLQLQES